MMKKFLTVLVLGLAMFSISCGSLTDATDDVEVYVPDPEVDSFGALLDYAATLEGKEQEDYITDIIIALDLSAEESLALKSDIFDLRVDLNNTETEEYDDIVDQYLGDYVESGTITAVKENLDGVLSTAEALLQLNAWGKL